MYFRQTNSSYTAPPLEGGTKNSPALSFCREIRYPSLNEDL